MERFYPVFLRIKDQLCIVVGGGTVATRKVKGLLRDGAKVTVISPQVSEELQKAAEQGEIVWHKREYRSGDLRDAMLVYAATNVKDINRLVCRDAEAASILVNAIDDQELCNFIVPSRVEQGRLQIAISTSGASPAFTQYLKKDLEKQFGNEYDLFLEWMQILRNWLLAHESSEQRRKEILHQVIQSSVLSLLSEGRLAEAREQFHSYVGEAIITVEV